MVPDIVYQKFEDVVGRDIPLMTNATPDSITIHTYQLGEPVGFGMQMELVPVRQIRFHRDDFSNRFISGPNLPSGDHLEQAIKKALGLEV